MCVAQGESLKSPFGWPFSLLAIEGDMGWRVTDNFDNLFPFWVKVSSQELLKIFEAFLVHDSNRCLEHGDLVCGLFFGLHRISILCSKLSGHETGEVLDVVMELEIFDENLVGLDQLDWGFCVPTFKVIEVLLDRVDGVDLHLDNFLLADQVE